MGDGRASEVLHYLRNLIGQRDGGGLRDGQLLARFVRDRDEAAFEVLVWRHGPMVLGVGRRVLHNLADAEDVLQATFLTLVRKAGTVGKGESLGSWLYKVAYRIALRAQARRAKTITDSRRIEDVPADDKDDEVVWRELRPLLDDAIARLPEKYRTVLVLCDLQGKTYREAAEQLGCPFGTVSTRVTRARQLLRRRLARHVPALSAGALSVALSRHAVSALPAPLTASVVRAAARMASDSKAAANIPSAHIADLMEGANQAMLMTRFKLVTMLAVIVVGLAIGAGAGPARDPTRGAAATHRDAGNTREEGRRSCHGERPRPRSRW